MDRIKFYSKTDLLCGDQLQKAEKIIESFDNNKDYNIVELLEFYNISKYIDNKVFLKKWDDNKIKNLQGIVNNMKRKIHLFFNISLNDNNFEVLLNEIPNEYEEDFFEIMEQHILNINVANNTFKKAIEGENIFLKNILKYKKIVKKYSLEIKETMIKRFNQSARILIEKYYLENDNIDTINIPDTLNLQDIEQIFINYINSENADSRYVELLSRDNKNGIVLNDKTKLLARKKGEELKEKILNNGIKFEIGYLVALDNEMSEYEGKKEEYKNGKFTCMYSKKWIESNLDFATLLNNFIYLFEYTDKEARIQLVNISKDIETFERITKLNARNSYNPNSTFGSKRYISLLQFKLYYEYLKSIGIRIEEIIEWFFKEYLVSEFNIKNYDTSMPSENSNYFEKCKSILPEFDHILKEYKFLVEDGNIDPELVSISSTHMFFKNIPSLINTKYLYLTDKEDNLLTLYYLFSNQCMLTYLPRFNEKYRNFCDVIARTKVRYDEYHEYERKILDWLINKKIIIVDKEGYIQIQNLNRIIIYKELNEKEVICYWKSSKEKRQELDIMINEGLLDVGNSLFSKNEQDYFNYYLNKSEFVDGYDIRNSNLHGTQVGDNKSDIHYTNYLQIMILLILIIIKINDELCLYNSPRYKKESEENEQIQS